MLIRRVVLGISRDPLRFPGSIFISNQAARWPQTPDAAYTYNTVDKTCCPIVIAMQQTEEILVGERVRCSIKYNPFRSFATQ
jgi:hypothetical protein